jgi:hypothetical protein
MLNQSIIDFWYHAHQDAKQVLFMTRKQRERKREEEKQTKARGPYKVAKPVKKQTKPSNEDEP